MVQTMPPTRTGDWGEVRVGQTVVLAGSQWRVVSRPLGGATITAREVGTGREHTGTPTGPVEVVIEVTEQEALAVQLVTVGLGGVPTGRKTEDGSWLTPVDFPDMGSLHAHLFVFHGVTGEALTLPDLQREHAGRHRPEAKTAWVQHVHDPRFLT
jgi:hypothetical protein